MAKPARKPPTPVSSIETLGARLQKIINSPLAQKAQAAIISKDVTESQDDWDQIIEAITQTDGVYVDFQDDGKVRVYWDVPDKND